MSFVSPDVFINRALMKEKATCLMGIWICKDDMNVPPLRLNQEAGPEPK